MYNFVFFDDSLITVESTSLDQHKLKLRTVLQPIRFIESNIINKFHNVITHAAVAQWSR